MIIKLEHHEIEKAANIIQDIIHEMVLEVEVKDGKLDIPSWHDRMRASRDAVKEVMKALGIEGETR